MTDPNRRDPRETGELTRAVFENPQVFIETAETGFRSRLRQMSEKVAASGSHIVLLCGPSSVKTETGKWRTDAALGLRLDDDTLDCDALTWYAIPNAKEAEVLLKKYLPIA